MVDLRADVPRRNHAPPTSYDEAERHHHGMDRVVQFVAASHFPDPGSGVQGGPERPYAGGGEYYPGRRTSVAASRVRLSQVSLSHLFRKGELVEDEILGPIDFLAVEFPSGRVTGEGFRLLMDLVQRGTIRVLDLEFVAKSAEGVAHKVELDTIEHTADLDITTWQAAGSRLLDESDIEVVAAALAPGGLAGIVVYENVWAVPLIAAIDRNGARIIGDGRVDVDDVLTAIDRTEPV